MVPIPHLSQNSNISLYLKSEIRHIQEIPYEKSVLSTVYSHYVIDASLLYGFPEHVGKLEFVSYTFFSSLSLNPPETIAR